MENSSEFVGSRGRTVVVIGGVAGSLIANSLQFDADPSRDDEETKVMVAKQDTPWTRNRTMRIIIQDDTHRDVSNWCSLPRSFLPKGGLEGLGVDVTKDESGHSKAFLLMVEPDDSVAAIKAYIQEEKGIPFKRQKLLHEDGCVLKDAQTLVSLGVKKGSTLILRYAPITQITVELPGGRRDLKLMVESDDTVADVKAAVQEKVGIRFHKQRLLYDGKQLFYDNVPLVNYGIEDGSVIHLLLGLCGC